MREIAELVARLAELERRVAGMMVHGTVAEVAPQDGTVRLKVGGGDGETFLSPAVPYAQLAGDLRVHTPPSVGQQMTMLAPGGDWRQATAVPMTWSDDNPSPSSDGDAHVLTFGNVLVELTAGGVKISAGGTVVDVTGDGLSVTGTTIALDGATKVTGAELSHNGHDVGDRHKHTGVAPGGSLTGPPA